MSPNSTYFATILIGPTAAGKTPLGTLIAERGLPDGAYLHFDFGQQLREIQRGRGAAPFLCSGERQLVEEVLRQGRLLRVEEIPIALRVLGWFLQQSEASERPPTKIVLNGLPRTVEQARAVEKLVRPERVVVLDCSRDVVWERILTNVGGDRTGRSDDNYDVVCHKFAQYVKETRPLVNYYQTCRVPIIELPVGSTTQPIELWQTLWAILDGSRG